MDLRQLRYFCAVARERNFTRAAEMLHIAQPPLSRQIQQLEDELGVALFIRSSRPIRLTDAGRLLFEEAQQLLGRMERMKDAARRRGRSERRLVNIGFVASTLYGGLPELIRRLRQRRPDIDVRLVEMMSGQQVEALKEGRIDIGFGRIRFVDAAISRVLLREERLVVAIPPAFELAHSDSPVKPAKLRGQHLVVYPSEPRPSFADQVITLLDNHGVHPPEIQEVRELQTALGLVAAETGICLIPAAARTLRPELHYRLVDDELATSPVVLSHRPQGDEALVSDVKQLIADLFHENPPWLDPRYNRVLTDWQE